MVEVGSRVVLQTSSRHATVDALIGEGSQGSVYRLRIDGSDEPLALKWYFPAQANARQRESIELLIDRGSPDHRFLWPLEMAERETGPPAGDATSETADTSDGTAVTPPRGFGYVMALRDDSSRGLADLLRGKVDIPFSRVCRLGMELADTFLALHNEGLCYRDISFGNVFFNPSTGQPLICDTDNVGVDGASVSAVLGTRRFMAPEIVRREATPGTSTDLYSLAVLLFYILMVGHPLVGRRELDFPQWDDDAETVLFGTDPVFVFDPDDTRNAPLPDIHAAVITNWALYPVELRELFTRAFTTGMNNPNARVRESIWRSALARSGDRIMDCPVCHVENFWVGSDSASCWNCSRILPDPVRIVIDGKPLVLNTDSVITDHHLLLNYDFSSLVASVTTHPQDPNRWGLRNEGSYEWTVVIPPGEPLTVLPGQTIGLRAGTRLTIGTANASIEGGRPS